MSAVCVRVVSCVAPGAARVTVRGLLPLLLALFAASAVAEKPVDYAYGIAVNTEGRGPFARFPLPPEVYEGVTDSGLADVRVFNADGDGVPFAFVSPPSSVDERGAPFEL